MGKKIGSESKENLGERLTKQSATSKMYYVDFAGVAQW